MEEQIAQEEEKPPEKLDLALKEGQTIKVNINMPKKDRRSKVRISLLILVGQTMLHAEISAWPTHLQIFTSLYLLVKTTMHTFTRMLL